MTTQTQPDPLDLDGVLPRPIPKSAATMPTTAKPSSASSAASVDPGTDLSREKLQRLRDYLEHSLANPDPEIAMLGSTTAQLMQMALILEEAIQQVLADCPSASARFATALRAIDALLRLTRQIDRFSHLKLLLTETRKTLVQSGRVASK